MIERARSTSSSRAPRFLEAYRASGNVRLSASAAGIDRDTTYKRRQRDPRFAADWAAAEEDATEMLEAEARRRAMAVSDTLLIFLLKARKPAMYRESSRLELTGPRGGPVAVSAHPTDALTPTEQAERLRGIAAELDPE